MTNYIFKPYNPIFPQLFEAEKKRLLKFLSRKYQIEHVGSTAVSSLGGKGVIDICLIVPKKEQEKVWKDLVKAGYKERENFAPDVMHVSHTIYLPDPVEEKRKYHIHIRDSRSLWLKEALAFRDYLRKHPKDVKNYAEIKQKAAKIADDNKDIYLSIKRPVVEDIMEKALK